MSSHKNTTKAPGGFKKLTLQLLTCGLNNFNKKRVALFKMSNLRHQVIHLTLKRRHLLHQAKRSPSLITAAFAWRFNSDNRPSRSEILDRCSAQWQGERGSDATLEFDIFAGGEL
jgi:hypothetical protein